ncbi:MAG TPA: hypothetical protein PK674_02710 [Candidatus Absconditabacterales bacterium]|nr:hypothetical protein [Candidatus Absconditabacterales bacterium]
MIGNEVILFDSKSIRKEFVNGERRFSVVDIVSVLTNSQGKDKGAYWRKLKQRLIAEGSEVVTNCHELKMLASDGKKYKTDASNTKGILRIIQSIPSPNAEPLKQRLASLGNERMEELSNPELGINRAKARAVMIRKKQGKDDRWITSRLQSIQTRNSFTDILKERGIKDGFEYALLTNKVYSVGLGVSGGATEYRSIKGIDKKDNLRDHMDNLEIALVDLAEAGSQKIIETKGSHGFDEVQDAVVTGSGIAGEAREKIENQIGKPIVSPKNYKLKDNT